MIPEGQRLQDHRSGLGALGPCSLRRMRGVGAGWTEMTFERGSAAGPDARGEFRPLWALFGDEAIGQVRVENRAKRSAAQKGKRGFVARKQRRVETYANEAGRLSIQQPPQVRGLGRPCSRAGRIHAVEHGRQRLQRVRGVIAAHFFTPVPYRGHGIKYAIGCRRMRDQRWREK
jgi:hypothetical protein